MAVDIHGCGKGKSTYADRRRAKRVRDQLSGARPDHLCPLKDKITARARRRGRPGPGGAPAQAQVA